MRYVLLLALFAAPVSAEWGPMSCSARAAETKVWSQGREFTYIDGVLRTQKDVKSGTVWDWDGTRWVEQKAVPCKCECCKNCACEKQDECKALTGVCAEKLSGRSRTIYGGQEVDKRAFYATPFDDGAQMYILVVGDRAFQDVARAKISTIPDASKFTVGYFESSDWQVKNVGLDRVGVSILDARDPVTGKGKHLHFAPTADGLDRAVVGALRKKDAGYKAEAVPDLSRQDPVVPTPPAVFPSVGPAALLAVLLAAFIFWFKRGVP